MGNVAVRVENLGKEYRIGGKQERYKTFRDTLTDMMMAPIRRAGNIMRGQAYGAAELDERIWALKDVSFEIKHGDVVGIIGRNGAGKSTLLKILSRITEPTTGRVELYGRVGALLEVGTGFHPELTGRENIYLNASILGMSRVEIERKFDEIVDFAEVEKFIDTPVKHYSSGMALRLGFAVAAHLEPEILVVDEVLAVGDAAFQKKCLGKMSDVAGEGRTVLFVSHNMAAVQNLCNFGCFLSQGEMVMMGSVIEAIAEYLRTASSSEYEDLYHRQDRNGDGRLRFKRFFVTSSGKPQATPICGDKVEFNIQYQGETASTMNNVHVSIGIQSIYGEKVLYLSNDMVNEAFEIIPNEGVFRCVFERFPLLPGQYSINLYSKINGVVADWIVNAAMIHVVEGDYYGTGKLPPVGYSVLTTQSWGCEPSLNMEETL